MLRVLSLNVCGLPHQSSSFPRLAVRAARIGRYLESSDVDVVNLQELFTRHHLALVRPLLPSFRHVVWRFGLAGRPAGGLATFSRHPLRRLEYQAYRGIAPSAGSLRFRGRNAVASAMAGVLVTELTDHGIVVANTHLTANKDGDWSATNRYHDFQRRQLQRLHAVLRRLPDHRPAVLTGDFNVASDSPLYPTIIDRGAWHDPFVETDPTTFQGAFLPPGAPPHRIDFLLIRGAEARDPRTVFAEPEDGIYLSDHIALTARIV
jgi:endonuclease/exonuclease/phosphatase family metal-dependent hydrolase